MPNGNRSISRLFAWAPVFCALMSSAIGPASAQNASWQVSKSSGEVWIITPGGQHVSVSADAKLNPGDYIRTGKTGRVILIRGEERIMVSPNTAIGIPAQRRSDLPTTITQQAGTILLDVEKKNVRHFEVETPYLAAVVKGTQFRVTVEKGRSRVEVVRGQVQVADFKSGQNVLVLPGQSARNAINATGGLQMSGKGRFNAIEQGTPRQSAVRAIDVPAGGLKAPGARAGGNARQQTRQEMRREMRQQMRPDGRAGQENRAGRDVRTSQPASRAFASAAPGQAPGITRNNSGGMRIGSTLGEVKLDYNKVTNGLARGASDAHASARGSSDRGGEGGGKSSSSLSAMAGLGTEGSLSGVAAGKGNGGGSGTGSAGTGGSGSAGGTGGGGGSSNAGGNGNGNAYGLVNGVVNGVGNGVGGLLGGLGLGKKK